MEVEKGSGAGISLNVNKVVYSKVTPGEVGPENREQGSSAVADVSKCGGNELPTRGSNVPKRKVPKRQIPRKDNTEHENKSDEPEVPPKILQPQEPEKVLLPQPQVLDAPQLESSSGAAHSPTSKAPSKEEDDTVNISGPQWTVPDGTKEEKV